MRNKGPFIDRDVKDEKNRDKTKYNKGMGRI